MLDTSTKCHTSSLSDRSCEDPGKCQTSGRVDGEGGLRRLGGSRMALLVLLLCLLFLGAASDGCSLKMQPGVDQNVTIGSTVRIKCSWRGRCTNSSFSISHNGIELPPHKTRRRSIIVSVDVTSWNDQGNYFCRRRDPHGQDTDDEEAVNYRVGYEITEYNISKAKFIFENQQNLLIYFNVTAPGPDDNLIQPEWRAFVKHDTSCLEHSKHGLTRTFLCQQHLYDQRFDEKLVIIRGRGIEVNVSENCTITPNLLVKPSTVSGVEVVVVVRQVSVTWNARVGQPELHAREVGNLTHSLTYQSQFDPRPLTVENADCNGWKCRAVLTDLVPHAQYNLSISCKPNHGGYPSDPYTIQIQTLTDTPETGPGLSPWSFSWSKEGSEVTIYPTEVPAVHSGGVINEYQVYLCDASEVGELFRGVNSTCNSQATPDMQLLSVFRASHSLMLRLPNLTSNGNVHMAVFATTVAGCSKNSSHLYIQTPQKSWGRGWVDTVQTNTTEFQVWFEPEDHISLEPEDTRLHWCCPYYSVDPTQSPACKEALVTQIVDTVSGVWSKKVTVHELCDTRPRFGVSPTRSGISSGIIWDSCLYDRHRGLATVTEPKASFEEDQRTIVVSWSMVCANKARPLSYDLAFISHNPGSPPAINLCDKAQRVTVNASHRGMEQRKTVETGLSYAICFRENNEDNHGPWTITIPQYNSLPYKNLGNTDIIINSTVSAIIVVIFLIAVSIAFWCKRQCKKTDKYGINFNQGGRPSSIYTLGEMFNDDFKIKPEFPTQETTIVVPDEATKLLVTPEEVQMNDSGWSEVSEARDSRGDYAFQMDDPYKLEPVEEEDSVQDSGRVSGSCDYAQAADQNIT